MSKDKTTEPAGPQMPPPAQMPPRPGDVALTTGNLFERIGRLEVVNDALREQLEQSRRMIAGLQHELREAQRVREVAEKIPVRKTPKAKGNNR